MSDQEFEYQVSVDRGCMGHNSDPTRDPKEAGRLYREQCKSVAGNGNGTVELKRRPIVEWETVESTKV